MGRKQKARYHKDLHQQAYERLNNMLSFGESRAQAKQDGTAQDKIFSYATYQTYWKHVKVFLHYIRQTHPECTTLKKARGYVNEWLQTRVDQGLSAWTIQTEAAALNKLYGITPDDPKRFQPPQRRRSDIKRSRVDAVRDKHFSLTNNDELIKFVCSTGTRRNVLERLEGRDLWTREQMERVAEQLQSKENLTDKEQRLLTALLDALAVFPEQVYFLHHRMDKGGRTRFAPIIGPSAPRVIQRMQETPPGERVWAHVHSNADIHGYRAEYATMIYKMFARNISEIPYDRVNRGTGKHFQGDVYVCRKDEAGRRLDRRAMYKCSKALGHNRISVVADHYLRGL